MTDIKKLYKWFMDEWVVVFLFAGFFAIVFQELAVMGWFIGGVILRNAWDHRNKKQNE